MSGEGRISSFLAGLRWSSLDQVSPQHVHRPGHALELHGTDIGDPLVMRGVDDRLRDQHLALARIVRDARGEVHGLAEVVALLVEDGPRVQADVRRWSPAPAPDP